MRFSGELKERGSQFRMGKRGRLSAFTITVMVAALVITGIIGETRWFTGVGHASTDASIKRLQEQINEIEKTEKELEADRKELKQEINHLEGKKQEQMRALRQVEAEISKTEADIRKKEKEVSKTEIKVEQTQAELKAAEARVEKRKEELINRLRAIYESGGSVSYLDVLMGATSIGDFLQRLDFLGYIMDKDQAVLSAYVEEQERVEQKKAELDRLLADLNQQLTDLEGLRSKLRAQQKDHEVQIASIQKEQHHLEEYDEEKQRQLLALSNKKSDLVRQKHAAELRKMEEERARQRATSRSRGTGGGGGGGGLLAWPVPGYGINSSYGMRWGRMHYGVDMAAPRGTSVVAGDDGYVSTVVTGCSEGNRGCGGGFGNYIVITHPGGINTLYAHLNPGGIHVSEGERVSRGQVIGQVGNTGRSTGPHLHFEVHRNGQRVNPASYLR